MFRTRKPDNTTRPSRQSHDKAPGAAALQARLPIRRGMTVTELVLVITLVSAVIVGLFTWNTHQEFKALSAAEATGLPLEGTPPFNSVCLLGADRILCTRWSGLIEVRSLATGELQTSWNASRVERHSADSTADGRQCVIGTSTGNIEVWTPDELQEPRVWKGHDSEIDQVQITPDGKQVISLAMSEALSIWDLATGKLLHTIKSRGNNLMCFAMSPNGQSLAYADLTGSVTVVNLTTGKQVTWKQSGTPYAPATLLRGILWNPRIEGELIAVSVTNIIQLRMGTQAIVALKTTPAPIGDVRTARLLSDGEHLVLASRYGQVSIFDLTEQRQICELQPHTQAIRSMLLVNGERELLTAGWDGTLQRWDLAEQTRLYKVR